MKHMQGEPFGLDSIVHDEWDDDTYKSAYNLVEENLLSITTNQTFFAILDDKLKYIKGNYNMIFLNENNRLLNKQKYIELESEFDVIN